MAGALVFLLAVAGMVYLTLAHRGPVTAVHADQPRSGGVDFERDPDANYAAAQGLLSAHLAAFPSYAGDQVVSFGIEVERVGPPTDAIRAVVARDDPRYQGKPVPVRYRSVHHSLTELRTLTDRILASRNSLRQQGIELSFWGPEVDSNTVEIRLVHYPKAYRDVLVDRYGSDWVTVFPHDMAIYG